MTQQQTPKLVVTVVRNPSGKKFDHWEMSVDGTSCVPAECTVTVDHGNNALITVTIADPNRPATEPQITFSNNPLTIPPTNQPEIKIISGPGTSPLVFKDHNLDKETLKYTLNFNNAPSIDPIIQNGGGGPPRMAHALIPLPTTQQQLAIDLGIAFILGIIVALIVRRLF